ncbi:MAG TPA: LLM class F420-dependent oxidoreductase [Actinomycetota bacterium]|nr:LLM class F420-dependent oxidoreductase [Actinomycetota bacterium]
MRLGLTVPVLPFDVRHSCELARHAEGLGYTDAWAAEASGTDGFSVASAVGIATDRMRVGIAIVPIFTRPPALLAMSTLAAQQACAGRFCLGLGASSPTIVERWMGLDFDKPLTRARETIEAVQAAVTGDKVDYEGDTVRVKGFRMEQAVIGKVPLFLAALGPKMLALAEEKADGVALFLASEEGVRYAKERAPSCETLARLICFVGDDPSEVRDFARWLLTPYLTVPGYNRFVAAQGFEVEARAVATAWGAGDRKGAGAAISDRLVDALVIAGPAQACRERIASFREAGLDTPILMLLSQKGPQAVERAIDEMAPSSA